MIDEKKVKDEVVHVKQQEQKKTLVWMNSIEPKQGHKLYEFVFSDGGFECVEIDISSYRPALTLVNVGGKFVNKEKANRPKIDFFNPDYKPVKKSIPYHNFKPDAIYITALNYDNACKKMKTINSHLFN